MRIKLSHIVGVSLILLIVAFSAISSASTANRWGGWKVPENTKTDGSVMENNTTGGGGECGYSPDEKYLRMCNNPNSLQNKRIQFLKKYPLKEIFNIKKLEFIDDAFKILKRPSIQYEALEEEELLTSMRNIPITAHIVRRTNSTGGFSESDLNDAISDVNKFYNGFNMNFYLCSIRFIDSDNIFNTTFSSGAEGGGTMASYNVLDVTSRNAEQTLNIYFVPSSNTSWAWRPNTDDRKQHILMRNSQATNGVTPSHEIGHWFDLLHTHGSSNFVMTNELVDGSNCSTSGDFVCDTPADPNLSGRVNASCNYKVDPAVVDANGAEFNPDTSNVLSYSRTACRNRFSDGQILRMQSAYLGMENDRGYTMKDCTPDASNNGLVHYWSMDNGQRTGGFDIYTPVSGNWSFKGIGDVNGDGADDVVWQNRDGQVHYWPMDNGHRIGGINISTPVGPDWNLRGVGDVNGDGTDDIIWQHRNGQVHFWSMYNGQRTGGINIYTPVGVQWNLKGVGDVNGDGTDDIVWQHKNGQVHYWPMYNGQRTGGINIYVPVGVQWNLKGIGDVNGDGTDDIVWQNRNGDSTDDIVWKHKNGQVHFWPVENGRRIGGIDIYTPVGNNWSLKGVGNVNGAGTADIIWQNRNGQVHYWPMDNGQRLGGIDIYTPVGDNWALKGIGDVNGDGTADIVWQHRNGQVHYWSMDNGQRTGGTNIYTPVGSAWDLRGVGDVNGDGTADIIWQHRNGQVHYWPMDNGQRTGGVNIYSPVGNNWSLEGVGDIK